MFAGHKSGWCIRRILPYHLTSILWLKVDLPPSRCGPTGMYSSNSSTPPCLQISKATLNRYYHTKIFLIVDPQRNLSNIPPLHRPPHRNCPHQSKPSHHVDPQQPQFNPRNNRSSPSGSNENGSHVYRPADLLCSRHWSYGARGTQVW